MLFQISIDDAAGLRTSAINQHGLIAAAHQGGIALADIDIINRKTVSIGRSRVRKMAGRTVRNRIAAAKSAQ